MSAPVDLSKVKATFGGGASPYGNFYNYYNFNPVSERFSFFPSDFALTLWQKKRAFLHVGEATDSTIAEASKTLSFLDIGCNEGNISIEMAALLAHQLNTNIAAELPNPMTIRGLGVDIDQVLIKRAIKKVTEYDYLTAPAQSTTVSNATQQPAVDKSNSSTHALTAVKPTDSLSNFHFDLSFLCGSIMDPETRRIVLDYTKGIDFPDSVLASTHTTAPTDSHTKKQKRTSETDSQEVSLTDANIPNVSSPQSQVDSSSATSTEIPTHADTTTPSPTASSASVVTVASAAVTDTTPTLAPPLSSPPPFDIVFVFSVTLWIHIHHGDEGLRAFLRSIASLTHNIVIEPQPWKCYLTCRKRWKKAGQSVPPQMEEIMWRTDVDECIINYLQHHCGFELQAQFGETKWERRLVWLTRKVEK